MDKQRLMELAGIQLTESHDDSATIKVMADAFEKFMDAAPVEQSDSDEWADASSTLMAGLHSELKKRGL